MPGILGWFLVYRQFNQWYPCLNCVQYRHGSLRRNLFSEFMATHSLNVYLWQIAVKPSLQFNPLIEAG